MNCGTPHTFPKGIATIIAVAMLFFVSSCEHTQKPPTIDAVIDRAAMPRLDATHVSTVISDSGITRYRISAEHWQVFDMAAEPYWEFTEGILLENFDQNLHIDASVQSDYARYNENAQLWELDGHVEALNLKGEQFETEQLFWDQRGERIYSDSLIKITRATAIIIGIGFESNQTMTKYTIRTPQGIFPVHDDAENDSVQP